MVPPVTVDGERVSSSGVRDALAQANFDEVRRWLGRPYSMTGRVVAGNRLGRSLGFPTANLQIERRRVPVQGIFAVRVHGVAAEPLAGVASLGTRPTVDGRHMLLEAHVFDFSGDLYGQVIDVELIEVRTLRPVDKAPLGASVTTTPHCVIVDEDYGYCGLGEGILQQINKACFDYLDAPIEYVHSDEIPVPFNHFLEEAMMPSVDRIVAAVREVCYR